MMTAEQIAAKIAELQAEREKIMNAAVSQNYEEIKKAISRNNEIIDQIRAYKDVLGID